jgi:hypothetical protein
MDRKLSPSELASLVIHAGLLVRSKIRKSGAKVKRRTLSKPRHTKTIQNLKETENGRSGIRKEAGLS